MKKRISAFLLSVVLCLTMICPAFAAGAEPQITVGVDGTSVLVSGTGFASPSITYQLYYRQTIGERHPVGGIIFEEISGDAFESEYPGALNAIGPSITPDSGYVVWAEVSGADGYLLGKGYWPVKAELSKTELTLTVEQKSDPLTATVSPEELKDIGVRWASDNEEVATVDPETGVVTAHTKGKANITATPKIEGGYPSVACVVTVEDADHVHTPSTDWTSDKTGHWHKCIAEGCDEPNVQLDLAAHTYGGEDGITCTVCGYKHTHTPSAWVTTDANVHWRTCTDQYCPQKGAKLDEGAHDYDVDGVCKICGRKESTTPTHTHSWSSAWNTDADYHWHECSNPNCPITANSGKNGYAAHSWNDGEVTAEATLYLDGVRTYSCTVCGYEKTEVIPALGGSIGGGSSTVARPGQSGGNTASSGSNASVVVNRPSSGSTGGTVTISDPNAKPGSKVDVTVSAKKGYALESITVKDSAGKEVALTNKGNGVYSFTMPEGKVSVDYSFTRTTAKPEVIRGEATFTDVKSDAWYSDAVQYAYQHGLMNGIGNNEFSPETNLTRAMIVQVLYNLEGTPKAPSGDFADVPADKWFADPVNWAAANGIVNGYGNGNFGPEDDITREQMAAILYRYAEYKGYDVTKRGELDQFSDVALVSTWATEAMEWAVGVGLITGTDKGELGPTGTATRAQVATVMMRFCENIMD